DLRLGHTGTISLYDSLSASIRRVNKETIKYMAEFIKHADFDDLKPENLHIFTEAREYVGNNWGALEDVLAMCAIMAKKANGPILETGTGLTTIALAAATDQPVYCLEHDSRWVGELEKMINEAGITNIHVLLCDIKDGYYEIPKDLPKHFSLALNDGPPRLLGDRMQFFEHFGDIENIIVDDADNTKYSDYLTKWCDNNGRKIDFIERSALIRSAA
ncbi:MAG: class I SAM-dependent methyltransferase, partial [Gammaproteobacteria bacterium]|nr:class I SAM-dependent methyltransferase [Gammaproteobacteria bacterium]